jgi:CMP/dCMP kinase
MFITIAGDLGSGKSSVGKLVAKTLNYKFLSIGDFMGDIAQEQGLSLIELSKKAMTDGGEIDKLLDEKQISFGKEHDNIVFDSRLGWYFIPTSLKIYLQVDLDVSAQRIFLDKREDEKENTSLQDTKKYIIQRKESERERYKKYYGLDFDDPSHFDVLIDTTNKTIEEVAQMILEEVLIREEKL